MSNTNTTMIDALAAAVLGSASDEMLLNECAGRGLAAVSALSTEALLGELNKRREGVHLPPFLNAQRVGSWLKSAKREDLAVALSELPLEVLSTLTGTEPEDLTPLTAIHVGEWLNTVGNASIRDAMAHISSGRLSQALGDEKLWAMVQDQDRVIRDYFDGDDEKLWDMLDDPERQITRNFSDEELWNMMGTSEQLGMIESALGDVGIDFLLDEIRRRCR